jgi:hypothetical protein
MQINAQYDIASRHRGTRCQLIGHMAATAHTPPAARLGKDATQPSGAALAAGPDDDAFE